MPSAIQAGFVSEGEFSVVTLPTAGHLAACGLSSHSAGTRLINASVPALLACFIGNGPTVVLVMPDALHISQAAMKRSLVSCLDWLEETQRFPSVFAAVPKSKAGRSSSSEQSLVPALVKTFLFLGFELLPPSSTPSDLLVLLSDFHVLRTDLSDYLE
ncbi:unnamed protein product [Protopolystoma xenopodis]|uniref:Uncharacterized protein n=1 Tax=Protopolystoma xenopodis TaxID=117903 RepID=A0A448X672_9PLAT|nr:unnamed protein product [Protopolystoma xenopodis]